jgi:hypothetical protein
LKRERDGETTDSEETESERAIVEENKAKSREQGQKIYFVYIHIYKDGI